MFTIFVDSRRWEDYKTLRDAKRARKTLLSISKFPKEKVVIWGPKGGKY